MEADPTADLAEAPADPAVRPPLFQIGPIRELIDMYTIHEEVPIIVIAPDHLPVMQSEGK